MLGLRRSLKAVMRMPTLVHKPMMVMPIRQFSADSVEKASQKLAKALESEINYENENYGQLEDIENFLTESGFQFHEKDHSLQMSLKKSIGDKTVEVFFDAR